MGVRVCVCTYVRVRVWTIEWEWGGVGTQGLPETRGKEDNQIPLNPTGAIVECRRFVESGCWSYLLAALASSCAEVRAASYHCLIQFRGHLEGARFREKTQVGAIE